MDLVQTGMLLFSVFLGFTTGHLGYFITEKHYLNNETISFKDIKKGLSYKIIHSFFFAFVFLRSMNFDVFTLVGFLFVFFGMMLSYIDIKKMEVPDGLNILTFFSGVFMLFLYSDTMNTPAYILFNVFAVIGLAEIVFRFVLPVLFRKEVMGEGDLLLIGLFGGLLGFKFFFFGIFVSALIYIILYLFLKGKYKIFPFIPALFVSFLVLWQVYPLPLMIIFLITGQV